MAMIPNYGIYSQPQQYYQQQSASQGLMTVLVQGESGASVYPVAAGNTMVLLDFTGSTFWLKSTDRDGIPQPMREFQFKEIVKNPSIPIDNNANFVSKQEFDELKNVVNQMFNHIKGGNFNDSSTVSNSDQQPSNV